jgi:hypothetical protein
MANPIAFVIPGLTRNPVIFWIPDWAFPLDSGRPFQAENSLSPARERVGVRGIEPKKHQIPKIFHPHHPSPKVRKN